ncbi:MAG: type II toxin-antitoxin system VapC family toxin [Anaerolineae bacterium]|nr:type II toxin-antitoxin system VapC family toxin [Anaerolineae bacterium]
MNGSRVLLDTNIVAAYFNQEESIREHFRNATIYIPAIVIGELYFGAYQSQRVTENVTRIKDFCAINTILSCDAETADRYGKIRLKLKMKGRPIPENDIWIAATAQRYDLTLVSRDEHFKEVDDLHLVKW